MAETIEKTDKQQPPILLFVVVGNKKEKQQAAAVQLVILWALFNAIAAAVAFAVAYTLSVYNPLLLGCWTLGLPTVADDRRVADECLCVRGFVEETTALVVGYVWCGVLQAAAAALALLVAGHRRSIRRALAYVALAIAFASHYILGGFVGALLIEGPPGQLPLKVGVTVATVTFTVGDALCFLSLLDWKILDELMRY